MPKVSVVMPVYNTEKYVGEAIESILNQTFKDFEFIIIEDGSTDRSWEIIQRYAKKDNRIKALQNKGNIGVVRTRKKLHSQAKGKYIAILDADDVALPDRLTKQFEYMERENRIAVVGGHIKLINSESKEFGVRRYPTTWNQIKKTIFKKSPLAQPAAMVRRDVFEEVGGYDNNFERCQDYELWTRLYDRGYKIGNIDDYMIKYRVFEDQGKRKHLKLSLKNTLKIQSKYIWRKKYFSISNILYWLAEWILYILPAYFVLWLFKKLEYGK